MKKVIESVFLYDNNNSICNGYDYILNSTGPWVLINLYTNLKNTDKDQIFIIPAKYVSPFNCSEARRFFLHKERSEELEECICEAYAVHYFFGFWRKEVDSRVIQ